MRGRLKENGQERTERTRERKYREQERKKKAKRVDERK